MVGTSCKYYKQYALLRLNVNCTNKTLAAAAITADTATTHLRLLVSRTFYISVYYLMLEIFFILHMWRKLHNVYIQHVDNIVPAPSDTQPIHHIRIINLIDRRSYAVALGMNVCMCVLRAVCIARSFIHFNPIHLMSFHFSYWLHHPVIIWLAVTIASWWQFSAHFWCGYKHHEQSDYFAHIFLQILHQMQSIHGNFIESMAKTFTFLMGALRRWSCCSSA